MVGGLCDAACSNLSTVFGGEDDIDGAEMAEFLEHASWFIAESCFDAQLSQKFPEHIGQEADEDMGEHTILFLMPDRA